MIVSWSLIISDDEESGSKDLLIQNMAPGIDIDTEFGYPEFDMIHPRFYNVLKCILRFFK